MVMFLFQLFMEIVLGMYLFFNVFVSKSMNTLGCLLALVAFLILNLIIHKYRKKRSRYLGEVNLVVISLSIVLIAILYLIGFKTGFNVSLSFILKRYITKFTWIKIFLIVILSEFTRSVVMTIDTRSKVKNFLIQFFLIVDFVLIDTTIATKSYNLANFNQLYEFLSLLIIQSFAKNLLLNYISKEHGYKPTLIYRFIVDLHIYFLPITPKLNVFIESCIMLIYPYVVFAVLRDLTGKIELGPAKKQKKEDGPGTFISFIIFAILVALVSREFEYAMIAIGSGSMTGTVNKGDAIVYQKYDRDKYELKEGDIIVFVKNNLTIVHRIKEVYSIDGVDAYKTKGDANESADNWIVYQEDVTGVVKFRIIYIAWPSVLLNEWF